MIPDKIDSVKAYRECSCQRYKIENRLFPVFPEEHHADVDEIARQSSKRIQENIVDLRISAAE